MGDSGFVIVRNSRTIFKSPVQQHQFNIPFQLENGGSDPPSAAQVNKHLLSFSIPWTSLESCEYGARETVPSASATSSVVLLNLEVDSLYLEIFNVASYCSKLSFDNEDNNTHLVAALIVKNMICMVRFSMVLERTIAVSL